MKLQTTVFQLIARKGTFTISLRVMQHRIKILYVQIGRPGSTVTERHLAQRISVNRVVQIPGRMLRLT